MRQIIEVLRLKYEAGLSHERIARAYGLSKGVVGKYVSLATAQGITWPLPEGTNEARCKAPELLDAVLHKIHAASARGMYPARTLAGVA